MTTFDQRRALWKALKRTLLKYNELAAADLIQTAIDYPGANDEVAMALVSLAMSDITEPDHA